LIRTADICSSLGLTPVELDRFLNGRSGLYVREGQRGVCLQLLPVTGDATTTLRTILDRAKADAERRIRQVMAYVRGNRCRHALLAAHLGEQLDPCGTSCDVCTNSAVPRVKSTAQSNVESSPTRTIITAHDIFGVLEGVRTLPFPMGKTGLAKLLTGSVESRVREDRASGFGVLAGFSRSKVEGLIDRLVVEGYLNRDMNHEFKLISLTRKGASATPEDLEEIAPPVKAPPSRSESAKPSTKIDLTDAELDDDDRQLLQVLTAWRREKAAEESVPPYIVAPNTALRNLALSRPKTTSMLSAVPGFGPVKVEKYGAELLRLIAQSDSPS
jgi:ATP-dependent DNA helicase RecQ